jgi:Ser/Thr protein kinase RdoA (MazF antagonist)
MAAHRTRGVGPAGAVAALEGREELLATIRREDGSQVLILAREHDGRPFVLLQHVPSGRSLALRTSELGTVMAALGKAVSRLKRGGA